MSLSCPTRRSSDRNRPSPFRHYLWKAKGRLRLSLKDDLDRVLGYLNDCDWRRVRWSLGWWRCKKGRAWTGTGAAAQCLVLPSLHSELAPQTPRPETPKPFPYFHREQTLLNTNDN